MRIALATCSWFPDGGLDDRPLIAALLRRGVEIETPTWDDPGVDWAGFDAVLIRSTWDYPVRLDDFLDWAGRIKDVTVLMGAQPVLEWNTTKTYLRDLAAVGLPIIPTVWLTRPGADPAAILVEQGWAEGFCKPFVGAGSNGTRRLTGTDEDAAWVEALIESGGAMLQPYRASVESDGEVSVIVIDGTISHSLCKRPKKGDYRVQEMFGARDSACALTDAQAALVQTTAEATAARFGAMPVVMRIDLLTGPDGPELCEVEMVEPCLFFRHHLPAADKLADALIRRLGGTPDPKPLLPVRWPAVVFDLDGTVLDSSELVVAALNEARDDLNLPPVEPASIRAGIGLPLRGMVAMLSASGEDIDAITDGYRTNYTRLAPLREVVFAGMKELIVDLVARGMAVGIATGKSQYGADNAARRHDLDHWITAVHGILPNTPGKPDPAVLRRALADLDVEASAAVFIGDTTYDMQLADAIGVDAIGVSWGVHAPAALSEARALAVVDSVEALRAMLLQAPV